MANLSIGGLFAVVLVGAAVVSVSPSGKVQPPADAMWMGFAAYPGARALCEQSVLGQQKEEIYWRSFAVKDDFTRVAAFYAKKDKASPEKSRDGSLTLRHDKGIILTIHRASPVNYPSCDQQARRGEKTVIIVSQMTSPGK